MGEEGGAHRGGHRFYFGRYTGPRPGASAPDAGSPPPPKADSGPPAPQPASGVPATISPTGAERVTTPNVTLESSGVTGATAYQFAIEYEGPSGYLPYYTYSTGAASVTFYPATHGISYRWQVRAEVGGAFGAWSPYATFDFP